MNTIYYIDYENIGFNGLHEIEKLDKTDTLLFFINNRNPCQPHLYEILKKTDARLDVVHFNSKTKNALDFTLCVCLGYRIAKYPKINHVIISKDKGFRAAARVSALHYSCSLYPSISLALLHNS